MCSLRGCHGTTPAPEAQDPARFRGGEGDQPRCGASSEVSGDAEPVEGLRVEPEQWKPTTVACTSRRHLSTSSPRNARRTSVPISGTSLRSFIFSISLSQRLNGRFAILVHG